MKYILDSNGEPLACEDIMQWGNWFETADRRVAVTAIDDPRIDSDVSYLVSTVFLGVDHRHFNGPPILWETMVFRGREGLWFDRCGGSREQAEAMHQNVCKKVMDKTRNAKDRIMHQVI